MIKIFLFYFGKPWHIKICVQRELRDLCLFQHTVFDSGTMLALCHIQHDWSVSDNPISSPCIIDWQKIISLDHFTKWNYREKWETFFAFLSRKVFECKQNFVMGLRKINGQDVGKWLQKLSEETGNHVWRENLNLRWGSYTSEWQNKSNCFLGCTARDDKVL